MYLRVLDLEEGHKLPEEVNMVEYKELTRVLHL